MLPEVREVLLAVGGVDDEHEVVLATVHEHVVHGTAAREANRRVPGLADREPGYVARHEALDCPLGVRSPEGDLAHVRDVE